MPEKYVDPTNFWTNMPSANFAPRDRAKSVPASLILVTDIRFQISDRPLAN